MLKHKLSLILLFLTISLSVAAQHDDKAKKILDNVASTYNSSEGMKIVFKGTQKGTIWLKGNCFVLECGGVKSWFDGETQWSYVADNDEVNISSPTPEEVQVVNPYTLVTMYRSGFDYRYEGAKTRNNQRGDEVALIPQKTTDIRMIILSVNKDNVPFYIGLDMKNGHYEEFILSDIQKVTLNDSFFCFNKNLYPNAEVIDLR